MKQIHFIGLYDLFSLKSFMGGEVDEGHSHLQGLVKKKKLIFFSHVSRVQKKQKRKWGIVKQITTIATIISFKCCYISKRKNWKMFKIFRLAYVHFFSPRSCTCFEFKLSFWKQTHIFPKESMNPKNHFSSIMLCRLIVKK